MMTKAEQVVKFIIAGILNTIWGLGINGLTAHLTIICARELFGVEWGTKFWIVLLSILLIKLVIRPKVSINIPRKEETKVTQGV